MHMNTELHPLHLQEISVSLESFTVKANLTVQVGERIGLIGKSGSGKTTLLRALAGLGSVDSGKMFLGSDEITHIPPAARGVGMVFQDQNLISSLNVLENATFGLRMKKMPRNERHRLGKEWLTRVGLASKIGSSVSDLSGGEKQRIAFVRALIWKPRYLLLDEPFSALDPEARSALRSELKELHQLWPAPLILVSHDEADLKALVTHSFKIEWTPESPVRQLTPVVLSD